MQPHDQVSASPSFWGELAHSDPTTVPNPHLSLLPSTSCDDLYPAPSPVPQQHQPTPTSPCSCRPPLHLRDHYCYNAIFMPRRLISSCTSYSLPFSTPYPISNFLSHNNLSLSHREYSPALLIETKPESFVEATKLECWRKAMAAKIEALKQNRT